MVHSTPGLGTPGAVASGHMSADDRFESTRRRLTAHQAETVARLADAAVTVLRERGHAALTVRLVAAEAGVAPATAYTYFSSKSHLLAEVFWRRLAALPQPESRDGTPVARVTEVMRAVALLVADEPELASGVTAALLDDDPEVAHLRVRIGTRIHERLSHALGPGTRPEVLEALEVMWDGALLRAGMGHQSYARIADRLETYARLILE